MTPGLRQLFTYYRVARADEPLAVNAAKQLQARLIQQHPGLHASLMWRPGPTEEFVTLMEIYAVDAAVSPQGIDDALQSRIELAAAPAMAVIAVGPRHVEDFKACA